MIRTLPRLLSPLALAVALAAPGLSQAPPLQQQSLGHPWDSGTLSNPGPTEQVLASHAVRVQNASWLRLRFQLVQLWNDGDEQTGAFLRITSHLDGAVQELRALHAAQWQYTSAYFNGDTVQLELVAPPGSGASRVILRAVWAGPQSSLQFSQCGPSDDRVPSSDARVARLMPLNCTGWIVDDCNHCFATAGHCGVWPNFMDVAEFNVPFSTPGGMAQHPSPDDQYAIDDTSIQAVSGGAGNDWAQLGCFANPNTGLTPFQMQGATFHLAPPPPFSPSETMRVTGHGFDDSPDPTFSWVQQTAVGPYFSFSGTAVRYEVDTTSGNSGSPVIWENGGGVAIGVHTHGGCSTSQPFGANWGTASTHPAWSSARDNPLGVCVPVPSTSTYCTAKVNTLGCTPTLGSSGSPSASGGAGSFTITAGNLLNQKSGLLYYGYLPLGTPFQGGFKCVSAPTIRTPVQSSGGAPSGSSCTGSLALDMGARIASGIDPNLTCGAIVYCQVWSRDPLDPFHTNLTGGLKFTIGM